MKNEKVWFVTGASKGLGLVLVKKLLKEGFKVAATSRNAPALIDAVGENSSDFCRLKWICSTNKAFGTRFKKRSIH